MATQLLLGTGAGVIEVTRTMSGWSLQHLGPPGTSGRIGPLALNRDGALFAGAGRRGLHRRDPHGSWQQVLDAEVWSVATAADGAVYAGVSPAAIFKSTDGGATWQELESVQRLPSRPRWTFPPPPHIPHVRTITFDPTDPKVVWAGVEEGGVIVSRDGGRSWEERNEGIYDDLHTLAVHTRVPSVLYATTGGGFYRSGNGGLSWQQRMEGMSQSYTVPIAVSPRDPDTLLVAAAAAPPPSWNGPGGATGRIFRSRDRGEQWELLTEGLPEASHEMIFGLAFDPKSPRTAYAAVGADLMFSSNEGDAWEAVLSLPAPAQSTVIVS